MKSLLLSISLLLFITVSLNAQTVDDKYGKDTLACKQKLSLYSSFVQQKSYDDALDAWRWVFTNCPKASKNIYLHGVKIMKHKIKSTKDEAVKGKYVDTLLMIYDQRIQYFGEEGKVTGRKGVDLYKYRKDSCKAAFNLFKKSHELRGVKTEAAVLVYYNMTATKMVKKKHLSTEEAVNVYTGSIDALEAQIAKEKNGKNRAKKLASLNKAKSSIDDIFTRGPASTREIIVPLFTKSFEENKDNVEYLEKVSKLLSKKKCTDEKLFFDVSEQLHKLKPSALSAYNLARMAAQKKQNSKSATFYKQAIELQKDSLEKAQYYYELAVITGSKLGAPAQARTYALKAMNYRKGWGSPYVLIAGLYAQSANSCGTNKLEKGAVYWVATDKLIRAKSIEPSLKVNTGKYKDYFPGKEDAFFYNVTEGSSYTVKCWINETTKARFFKN